MFLLSFIVMIVLISPYKEFHFTLNNTNQNKNFDFNTTQTLSQLDILNNTDLVIKNRWIVVSPLEYILPNEIKSSYANLYIGSTKILFLYSYYMYYTTKTHCLGALSNCYIQSHNNCLDKFIKCNFYEKKPDKNTINLTKRCINKQQCNKKDLKELERVYSILSVNVFPNNKLN